MGATNTNHYSDFQNEIAKIAKAMGHPARVAIVDFLIKESECMCGDDCQCGDKCNCSNIVKGLPLAQPTVSQHLKELKNAGIIKGTIEGNAICYCIDKHTIEKIKGYLSFILENLETKKGCCP
jgi:DNA-binding transcriptional ArsR family regulator